MRRTTPILRPVAIALSLVVCLTCAAVWVAGAAFDRRWWWHRFEDSDHVSSVELGSNYLLLVRAETQPEWRRWMAPGTGWRYGPPILNSTYTRRPWIGRGVYRWTGTSAVDIGPRDGFASGDAYLTWWPGGTPPIGTPCRFTLVPLPFGPVALIAAVPPALWARRFWRGRRAARVGRCPECGYDLRATPERCPECGASSKAKPHDPAG